MEYQHHGSEGVGGVSCMAWHGTPESESENGVERRSMFLVWEIDPSLGELPHPPPDRQRRPGRETR